MSVATLGGASTVTQTMGKKRATIVDIRKHRCVLK